ncbi:helix-turn-helix transcriptional regulator [Leucobacter chromiireducens]|uniref:helix-turn-helix transcriptional regulator n=1 Tax=Leucobacter chromiireducens TaxID=283877 RepID=UPI000F643D89|nr:AraC family transcriptional regulator [Leucobacter chromiireducens]
MNAYRQPDWASSGARPPAIRDPYLLTTGVVRDGDVPTDRPIAPPHTHPEAMLAWCYRGTVWVYLEGAMWQLGPGQGIWLPPHTPHTARHEADATGCYTYLPDGALGAPVTEVSRVAVPRAVQEMLLHLASNDMDPELRIRIQGTLIELLQLPAHHVAEEVGEVPVPADERVRGLVEAVLAEPGDRCTARELFARHGLHERTVLRVFTSDIGMSFGQWRAGVRMTAAARRIVAGEPIGLAGQQSGYDSTSAFSAAFKTRFGVSPRQYVARARADSAQRSYWR